MDYYLAIKRNEILIHAAIQMILENIPSEAKEASYKSYERLRIVQFYVYDISTLGKSTGRESILVVSWECRRREKRSFFRG